MSGMEEIGCYGAYCGTCREYLKTCKGCKPVSYTHLDVYKRQRYCLGIAART